MLFLLFVRVEIKEDRTLFHLYIYFLSISVLTLWNEQNDIGQDYKETKKRKLQDQNNKSVLSKI
jgi:hypothetical protein